MKSLGLILSHLTSPLRRPNARIVAWLVLTLVVLVTVYSVLFHVLMDREGRDHSWATGVYWTFTTMSTLGFGDITFESDAGRLFSVIVLISGALFILVLLPFAFIQFVFLPWMARRDAERAPRRVPDDMTGHLVLTGRDGVTDAVIRRADDSKVPYVLIVPDVPEALELHDRGIRVMVGSLDDPATYTAAGVERARLVATTRADTTNTNIAFTVREINAAVPVVATASTEEAVDVLELAGANHVLRLGELLGQAMARRVLGRGAHTEVIGEFGDLRIAEASVADTELVGMKLRDARLRERFDVTVAGLSEKGLFRHATPETEMTERTVLILAGSDEQLAAFDAVYARGQLAHENVVIIGGGRVGRAAARRFREAGVPYRLIEQRAERVRDPAHDIVGDAADVDVLREAGLPDAASVLITTRDDDVNVYLTLYCRRLEPDLQVIARANLERNVSTLHRAGADAVLSYSSLGSSAIWNVLGVGRTLVLAEGLTLLQLPVPKSLVGKSLRRAEVRQETGCTVVAISRRDGTYVSPAVDEPLPPDVDLVVIGDTTSEQKFLARHPTSARDARTVAVPPVRR
jgi:Trk K+ transport system NAD-binding subunit